MKFQRVQVYTMSHVSKFYVSIFKAGITNGHLEHGKRESRINHPQTVWL